MQLLDLDSPGLYKKPITPKWPVTIIVSAEGGPLLAATPVSSAEEFGSIFPESPSWPDVWAFFRNAENPDLQVIRAKSNACDFAKSVDFVASEFGLIIAPEAFRLFRGSADLVRLTKRMVKYAKSTTKHIVIIDYPDLCPDYMRGIEKLRIRPVDTPHCVMLHPSSLLLDNGYIIGASAPFAALNQDELKYSPG